MSDLEEKPTEQEFESDDFGDFDDFDEFEEPQFEPVAPQTPAGQVSTPTLKFQPDIKKQVHQLLKKTDTEPLVRSEDRFTRTAVGLWHQLMEDPNATFLQWDGSSLHRKLVQSFGVPLNLDQVLPRAETRKMNFETTESDMKHIPQWTLLSIVSERAIAGMSEEECEAHNSELRSALKEAQKLLEALEGHEMDLMGEKDVLEGMVDSLLAYSQKSQRDQLNKKKKA